MVKAADFVARVEQIAAEEPRYQHGHDGSDGYCDCIGLIIGAIRRAGGQWRGMHGSNYAARQEVTKLSRIAGSSELSVGEVVFKAYEPGQGGYNLPSRYNRGGEYYNGDLLDYYHVGVVVSNYPLRIRHMTTPKPKMDTSIGKWSYHGKLKKVDYAGGGGGEKVEYKAKVIGGALNMREQPQKSAERLCQIPDGSIITVTDEALEWAKTSFNGRDGWVMKAYLEPVKDPEPDPDAITVSRKVLEAIYDTLGDMLGLRG